MGFTKLGGALRLLWGTLTREKGGDVVEKFEVAGGGCLGGLIVHDEQDAHIVRGGSSLQWVVRRRPRREKAVVAVGGAAVAVTGVVIVVVSKEVAGGKDGSTDWRDLVVC